WPSRRTACFSSEPFGQHVEGLSRACGDRVSFRHRGRAPAPNSVLQAKALMKHNPTTRPPCRWILWIGLAVLLFASQPAPQDSAARVPAEASAGQKSKDPLVEL